MQAFFSTDNVLQLTWCECPWSTISFPISCPCTCPWSTGSLLSTCPWQWLWALESTLLDSLLQILFDSISNFWRRLCKSTLLAARQIAQRTNWSYLNRLITNNKQKLWCKYYRLPKRPHRLRWKFGLRWNVNRISNFIIIRLTADTTFVITLLGWSARNRR